MRTGSARRLRFAPDGWRTSSLLMLAGAALAAGSLLVPLAFGATAPIPYSSDLPWSDPAHQSPLELLASQIASHIAGRPVSVQCEGDGDWATLVGQQGLDPSAESGYVQSEWNSGNGELVSLGNVAVLASSICLPLQQFAMATTKPTTCLIRVASASGAAGSVAAVRETPAAGAPGPAAVVRGRKESRAGLARPGPCFGSPGGDATTMPASYWASYTLDAIAILTLAHESIHLGGVVGGVLPDGTPVGDPQAEAKADCGGMQWMPYVAEQLGDSPADAHAIARFFWTTLYPSERVSRPLYWSADCRPGGALDLHLPGTTAWP